MSGIEFGGALAAIRSSGLAQRYQLIAPTRVNVGGQSAASLSGGAVHTTRLRVDPLVSSRSVRLKFENFIPGTGGIGEQPAWSPLRLRVSLEYLAANGDPTAETGLRVPVFSSSLRTIVVDYNGEIETDPVPFNVIVGVPYFIRVARFTTSKTMIAPWGLSLLGGSGEGGLNNGEGSVVGDATDVGTVTQAVAGGYGPSIVSGLLAQTLPCAGISGDSIPTGTGDTGYALAQGAADGGWLVRALSGQTTLVPVVAPAGPKVPFVRASTGGESLTGAIGGAGPSYGSPRRKAVLSVASTIFGLYGINDFNNGVTLATLQALALQDAAYWLALGKKYVRGTLLPVTTSTNGGIDVAGQTQKSYEASRASFNSWVRDTGPTGFRAQVLAQAGVPANAKVAIIDPAAVIEVNSAGVLTLNGGYWMPALNGGAALASGTFSTGTAAGAYTDSAKSWSQDQWRGYVMRITSGAASGYCRTIGTNNGTRLRTVVGSGVTEPSVGDSYVIMQSYTEDWTHPSSYGAMTIANACGAAALVE